jgi:hypothetical protein
MKLKRNITKSLTLEKKKNNNQIQNEDKLSDIFENMKVQFK